MRGRRSAGLGTPGGNTWNNVQFHRRAAEALALELAMLARAHDLSVKGVEITVPKESARTQRQDVEGKLKGRRMQGNTGRPGRDDT